MKCTDQHCMNLVFSTRSCKASSCLPSEVPASHKYRKAGHGPSPPPASLGSCTRWEGEGMRGTLCRRRQPGPHPGLSPVELFILGVGSVICRPHRQQHDVLARGLLKGQGHGNTAAFPGQVCLNTKNWGKWNKINGELWGPKVGDLSQTTIQLHSVRPRARPWGQQTHARGLPGAQAPPTHRCPHADLTTCPTIQQCPDIATRPRGMRVPSDMRRALPSIIHKECPTCLHGSSSSHVMRVTAVGDPGLPTVAHVHLELVGAVQFSKLLS